jgi:hypothetical protein
MSAAGTILCAAFLAQPALAALPGKFTNPFVETPTRRLFSVTDDFTLMAENSAVSLYLNKQSLAIRILNKKTGYLWSSDVDDFGEDYLNSRWQAFIKSGVTIEYYLERVNASGRTTVDRSATEESFLESGFSTARITAVPDGFKVDAVFGNSGIGVSYQTRITADGIETTMDAQSVVETDTERIVSIQFYPFLGAVRQGTQDGYFVLPDGDGSLIRFDRIYNNITRNYQKRYYGADRGISPEIAAGGAAGEFLRESEAPNYPVYGVIHGIHGNGFVNEIRSGAAFAELLAYPAGVRTNYYFISNRFLLRQPYTYIISTGSSTTMLTPQRAEFRIEERAVLLDGADADYTGAAKTWRASLIRRGLLSESRAGAVGGALGGAPGVAGDIPLCLNVLAGAANEGIFRNSPFVMTGIAAMGSIAADLRDAGVRNIEMRPFHLFKHDLSGSERDRYTLWPGVGSAADLLALKESLEASGGRLVISDAGPNAVYSRTGGIDLKEDVIRNINKRYNTGTWRFGAVNFRDYNLNSRGTAGMIVMDAGELARRGFTAESISLASPASSFNEKSTIWRDAASAEIAAALSAARKQLEYISAFRGNIPPEYFPSIDSLAGVTMSAALYPYITDTIPFTSIVLRGSMDLFTENLNNTANPEENLLRMIEWGVYPAYRITGEDANKLLYSDVSRMQASKYGDWREEIITVYHAVNAALKPVKGAAIADHAALAEGIMKTSYENGAAVYVNYTQAAWEGEGVLIPARGYKVRLP